MTQDYVGDFVRQATIQTGLRERRIGYDEMAAPVGHRDRRPTIAVIGHKAPLNVLRQF